MAAEWRCSMGTRQAVVRSLGTLVAVLPSKELHLRRPLLPRDSYRTLEAVDCRYPMRIPDHWHDVQCRKNGDKLFT